MKLKQFVENFHTMYEIDLNSNCWLWNGVLVNGYGYLRINGKHWRAHRLSWAMSNGDIPEGYIICHDCDTPRCVNPSHLKLGTPKDNAQDRERRGRRKPRAGARHPMARLTASQVLQIRRMVILKGMSHTDVARQFGVAIRTIGRIANYEAWRE